MDGELKEALKKIKKREHRELFYGVFKDTIDRLNKNKTPEEKELEHKLEICNKLINQLITIKLELVNKHLEAERAKDLEGEYYKLEV